MATQSTYPASYSHHHQVASSSVHSSLLHGLSGHPSVFEMSTSSPSILYPSTPIRDVSGSASIFSQQSDEQQSASSLTAFISTLSSPSPYHAQHHHAASAQQYYMHPPVPYEDGLPIQAQHTSPSHSRLQPAASAKETLSLAEYSAQLRHQHFLRQTSPTDVGGVSPSSGHSDSHSGGDVFSHHSSESGSRLSSSASSPSPLRLSSTPSSSPHSFASAPRDGRPAVQPVPAVAATPSTPVFDDGSAPFPSSSAVSSSSSFVPLRKRKGQLNNRKIACHVCHLAKTSCDGSRPCSRCVRLGKQPLCHDRPSKVAKVGDIASIVSAKPVVAAAVPAAVVGANDAALATPAAAAAGTGAAAAAAVPVERKEEKRRPREESKMAEEDRDDSEEQHSDSDAQHSDDDDEEQAEVQHQSADDSNESDAASSVDSPSSPSSSPSPPRPFNMDEHLSRSLLRAHLRWNDRQKQGDAAASGSVNRMNLREKLVYFTWLTNMMRPQHVEELVHNSPDVEQKVKDAKERKQKEDEEAGVSDGRAEDGSRRRRSNGNKQRRSTSSPSCPAAYKPCDGTACDNFCPSARVWAAANPCSFTWHHSPEEAIADAASAYPQLILRSLVDDEVSAEQNRRIVHSTLMLRKMEKIGETQSRVLSRHMAEVKEEVEEKMKLQQDQQQPSTVERKEDGAAEAAPAASSSDAGSVSPGSEALQYDDMGSYRYLFCGCDSFNNQSAPSYFTAPDDRAGLLEFNRKQSELSAVNTTTTVAISTVAAPCASPSQSPSGSPSASSSASSGFPSASMLLPPQPPIEVPMSVCVNAAFERLFGWSQAELRQHLIRDGGKTLYLLTRRDSWERLMELDQEANWGQQHEYRTYAVCVNKYRGEIHCLLHTVYSFNDDGKFSDSRTTFIPLPDPRPPNLRDDDDEDDDRRRRRKAKADKNRKDSKASKPKSRHSGGKRDGRAERGERD